MGMTLRIEIFPNDLGPTVDFYTGVMDFRLVRDESAYAPSSEVTSNWGGCAGQTTAQILAIGAHPPASIEGPSAPAELECTVFEV